MRHVILVSCVVAACAWPSSRSIAQKNLAPVTPPARDGVLGSPYGDYIIGDPISYKNLSIFPISSKTPKSEDRYTTLDEGLAAGSVTVSETGAGNGNARDTNANPARSPQRQSRCSAVLFSCFCCWSRRGGVALPALDAQNFIMLGVLICSGVAAWSYAGRRRAFWIGFFATLICLHLRVLSGFEPHFWWAHQLASDLSGQMPEQPGGQMSEQPTTNLHAIINRNICFAVFMAAAFIIGLLCVYVYDAGKRLEKS